MRREIKTVILIAAIAVTTLNGCSSGRTKGEVPSVTAQNKTEASDIAAESCTITYWMSASDDTTKKYYTEAAKSFTALNPEINVQFEAMPMGGSDIDVKLNAAILSQELPDVIGLPVTQVSAREELLLDLSEQIQAMPDIDDFEPGVIESGRVGDKYYGMAFYPNPTVLAYRSDYFEEAGLNPDNPPATWEELKEYAEKLVMRDSAGNVIRGGLDVPVTDATDFYMTFLRQADAPLISEDRTKAYVTDEKAVNAFEFMAELSKQSIPYSFGKSDEYPFFKGNSAMGYATASTILEYIHANPDMKEVIRFAPPITGNIQSAMCANRVISVTRSSKNPEAAWKFIQFMLSSDQIMERARQLSVPAVRKSLTKDFIELNPFMNEAVYAYSSVGKSNPAVAWWSSFGYHLRPAYEKVCNGTPAADALAEAEAAMNKELDGIK